MPTPTGPPTAYGTQQTVQIGDVQNAPGGAIECDSGKLLFFYTRSVSHVGSGSITMRTATSEAAANAGTFSSPTTIVAEGYPYYYGYGGAAKIALGAHAGRVWVAYARANLPSGTHIATELIYTDDEGATWSSPVVIDNAWTGWLASCCASPIVELPSGDLVIALYGRNTGENASWCKMYRSTDDGATWAYDSTIVSYESTNDQAEPALALVRLANGTQRLVCAINSWDTDLAYSTATINIVYTDDLTPGATWSARADSGLGVNWGGAPALWQALDGSVFLLLRNTGANAYKTYFSQSLDFGAAGSFTTSTLVYSTGSMRYGEFINLQSGRLGLCFGTETSTENAAIYWKVYELAAYTPDLDPPTITGSDVDVITDSGATITGNVDPNAAATTYRVQYGETTSYGTNTSWVSAGSGSSPVAIEVPLAGLAPGTAYHARLVAENAGGTTNGPDVEFTTDAAPVPDVGLTLAESGIWTQSGTAITARALTGRRSTVTATAYSEHGGAIWGDGEDADRFDIDGESIDGESTIILEPLTPRVVEIGVTPQDGDDTLTIRIGVPL